MAAAFLAVAQNFAIDFAQGRFFARRRARPCCAADAWLLAWVTRLVDPPTACDDGRPATSAMLAIDASAARYFIVVRRFMR